AIIGNGVQLNHPDLAANIWENTGEIPGNHIDDDLNGFVDDRKGWNFYDNNNDPSPPIGGNPHDTRVAGVAAAASDNAQGVAGVCWTCKIMALRVSDGNTGGTTAVVAQAINYATNNGASVINMSFGSYDPGWYGPDTVVEYAVNNAYDSGLTLVGTAGNNGWNVKRYPGALTNVIDVSATDMADARAPYSNYGSWVDVAAPGG